MTRRRPVLAALLATSLLAMAPAASAQSRTSLLHDALKLSPTQEPAWRAYLASSQPSGQQQAQAQATARLAPTLPTPRRLALIRSQIQSDLASFDRTAQGVLAFYAQLTPAQQATFDHETLAAPQDGRR